MKSPGKSVLWLRLPAGVWALGLASLFMDASSELIHSLLPIYITTVLGASMATLGVIEGVAESTASIVKVFSGMLSDYLGRRKLLAVLGYTLAAVTKPVFPLASSIGWVVAARFVDRVGKGIRGAPRDALLAEIAPPESRGAAFGLRQSLDSVGAFIGPLLAMGCLAWFANNIRPALWVAVIPACITVALIVLAVHEPEGAARRPARSPIARVELRQLGRAYWLVVALASAMTLARFSEAFLIMRAQHAGLAIALVPLVLVVMNIVYSASAYPAGWAADRMSHRALLVAGLLVLVAADLVLALSSAPIGVFIGVALWGLHMGLTQGLLTKLVADTAPQALLGTAFGLFNLAIGLVLFLASLIAGQLWERLGVSAPFFAGALFAGIAAVGMLLQRSAPKTV